MSSFVNQIDNFVPDPDQSIYESIFKQYERVVIESLITSFGLDIFIKDQHGGDVDTIHNVRAIGVDGEMTYKSKSNQEAYESRGDYDFVEYHKDPRFRGVKHAAREEWKETGIGPKDAYENGDLNFFKNELPHKRAELDHIVECKAIHDDRGRVLSGINGKDLANAEDNLAWTNKSLNASMGSWARGVNDAYKKEHGCDAPMNMTDMRAYLAAHPDDFDESTKKRMLAEYDRAKQAYEAKISRTYYTSKAFFKDSAKAATTLGVKMGLRQAIGFVFSEIWFSVKDKLKAPNNDEKTLLNKIGEGVKAGFENAKKRYKEIFDKFINGAVAGVLSSLVTTISNIFFTTAKNTIRIIRQSWASMVEAVKILIINPDYLPLGERLRAGTKCLATGASVVLGTLVNEAVSKTGLGSIPTIGDIISVFCGALVTGILSCTLLAFLDRNNSINKIVKVLNSIPTVDDVVRYHRIQAQLLDEYCAKLEEIDIERFNSEIDVFYQAVMILSSDKSEEEMNSALKRIYQENGMELPWSGYPDFNSAMNDKDFVLSFK